MLTNATADAVYVDGPGVGRLGDANNTGVSWGAVFAGATAAAALSLILLMLGLGLGLSSISPWSYHGAAIGDSTIAWLTLMQILASGLGGYLAGRLRVKWARVHTDEVHFRDTAHGLLAWALATLVMVGLLAGGTRAVLSGTTDLAVGTTESVGAAASSRGDAGAGAKSQSSERAANMTSYYSDMLLRSNQTTVDTDGATLRPEVNRIFGIDLVAGKMSPDDVTYLGQLVAKRTGASQADAEARVNNVFAAAMNTRQNMEESAKEAADKVRKAAAHSALWMFIALLIGAFAASLAATFGGQQRDNDNVVVRS